MSGAYSTVGLSQSHCSARPVEPSAVSAELLVPLLLLVLAAAVPGGFAIRLIHRAAQGGMANADCSKGLKQSQLSSKASFWKKMQACILWEMSVD